MEKTAILEATKEQIMQGLDVFIEEKVAEFTGNNVFMKLAQPTIMRGVKNSIYKYEDGLDKFLNFITDKDGKIDIEGVMNDTIEQFKVMEQTPIKLPYVGEVMAGEGKLEFDFPIPMTNKVKHISFGVTDMEELRDLISAAKAEIANASEIAK